MASALRSGPTAFHPIRTFGGRRSNVRKGSTAAHHRPPLRTASLFVSGRRCGAADPRPQQSFRSSAFPDDVASSALLATTSRLGSRRTGSYGGIRPRLWRPLPALTRGHPLLVSALLPNAERGIAEEIATSGTSAGECVNARPPGSRSSSPVWAVRQAGTPRAWRVAGSRPALPSALARPCMPHSLAWMAPVPTPLVRAWARHGAPPVWHQGRPGSVARARARPPLGGRGRIGEPEHPFIFAGAQGTHVRPPSVPGMLKMVDRAAGPEPSAWRTDAIRPHAPSWACHGADMASARRTDEGLDPG